jgi:8-oxo-dGTP diphosphatase
MAGIYITSGNKMLLLYRVGSRVVPPSWCNIGGHFEQGELNDPRACALREVFEEAGIRESDLADLSLRYITLRYKKNEVRQNYYFFAELANADWQLCDCDEGTLAWTDMEDVLGRDMPFTSKEVLKHYLSVGKKDKVLYAGIASQGQVSFLPLQEFMADSERGQTDLTGNKKA